MHSLLANRDGTPRTVATLLYGAGLLLLEPLRLRIQDQTMVLTVRSGKGDRDRRAILPAMLKDALGRLEINAREM